MSLRWTLLWIAALAGCREQRPPAAYPVWGVDVSHHQRTIDWGALASDSRFKFAYIKATEGGDYLDPAFTDNWTRAKAVGLRVGAYHYFTFCRPAEDQARQFLSRVPAAADNLPPVVDVEFVGNCKAVPADTLVQESLRSFLAQLESATHKRPIIYSPDRAWERFGGGLRYPLWSRAVGKTPPDSDWSIWQFADQGRVPGIASPVDIDAFNGDLGALARL